MEVDREHLLLCLALSLERGWFSLDELAHFVSPEHKSPISLLKITDALARQDWIRPKPRAVGVYSPTPKAARSGLTGEIPALLNLSIAEYFRSAEQANCSKIARHYELAGAFVQAMPFWIEAIKESFSQGQNAGGMELVSRVFIELPKMAKGNELDHLILESFTGLFESVPLFRSIRDIDVVVDNLIRIFETSDSSPTVLKAMAYVLSILIWRGQFNKAGSLFLRFFRKSRSSRSQDILMARKKLLGVAYYLQGKISRAVRLFDSTSCDTEHLPENPILLEYYIAVAHCYALAGRISRSIGLLDSIRMHAHMKGLTSVEGWALSTLSVILIEAGRYDRARQVLDELQNIKGWDQHYLNRLEYLWANVCLEYSKGHYSSMAAHLENLVRDDTREYGVAGYFTPTAVEIIVALMNMDRALLEKTGLIRITRMLEGRILTDSRHPVINAAARVYQALFSYLLTGDAMAVSRIEDAEKDLLASGCHLMIGKARIIKATILCEQGLAEEAVQTLKGCQGVIQEFGNDLLSGYLRDMLAPEPPEKLLVDAIMKISHSLGTLADRDTVIQKALEIMNRLTRAERGAIFIVEENQGRQDLVLKASQGITRDYAASEPFRDVLAWIHEGMQSRHGRLWKPADPVSLNAFQPRDAICAPLIIRGEAVGAVYQDSRIIGGIFNSHHIDLIQALATQIAASLDNSRIFSELNRLNTLLTEKCVFSSEAQHKEHRDNEIIARSKSMKTVLELAHRVAPTESAVLLTGETGVGKEMVAAAIHASSPRRDRPFIKVNCANLPEGLIESELFGHEKGAFTGASSARLGRFELADGGTVFLDEIAELPIALQAKLLRVLQEGEFERLGSTMVTRVNIRVIAATNRDLEKEMENSRFRPDLFFRLNTFPVHIPPLRERREDIPELAQHFLELASTNLGRAFSGITKADLAVMKNYPWPGNVRELRHVIERSAILSSGSEFRLSMPARQSFSLPASEQIIPLKSMERMYIEKALRHTGWKLSGPGGTAELLDIKRTTLAARMKSLGIERPWKNT